jgi:hypothetical protein
MLTGVRLQYITHVYLSIYMALFQDRDNKPALDAAIISVFIYVLSTGLYSWLGLAGSNSAGD